MAGDDSKRAYVAAEHVGRAARRIAVVDAVESEAPDAFVEPFVRAGVDVSGRRERRVKGRIEDRYLRHSGTEDTLGGLDGLEFETVVRGRQLGLSRDGGPHVAGDARAFRVCSAALHDAMGYDIDRRRHGFEHGVENSVRGLDLPFPLRARRVDGKRSGEVA